MPNVLIYGVRYYQPAMSVLALGLLVGCAGESPAPVSDESIPVLITPAASREGLPQPPRIVASKRDEQQLRRAEAAYSRRIDAVVRTLLPELRRAGARSVAAVRLHGVTQIRAAVPRDVIPSLEARPDVARVVSLVRRVGRVARRDLALILTTKGGRKYELRGLLGADAHDLDGSRIEVVGEEWRGAVAPPPTPGLPTFIVYDWRSLE
jgi:hypothetical protein